MDTQGSASRLSAEQQLNGSSSRSPGDGSSTPRSPRVNKGSKSMKDKRSDSDFIFGKLIGEGSFSSVYLAKDIHTSIEYAVKVCEKDLIIRENKVEQVTREKNVMNILNNNQNPKAPFFVKLSYAFQGEFKLYFVMTYCKNGELLNLIQRVGNFDRECARFYTAEIVRALEHLHSLNIIHRDLKPENILLDERMHIKITDFGSAKILSKEEVEGIEVDGKGRKKSFVGTAQYVSPELLESKKVGPASDLWALGCILYQMVSGLPPFRSRSEYLIFKKILKLEYEFPDGFFEDAKDLVQKLLVLEGDDRLGARDRNGYPSIRSHPLFAGLDFDSLHELTPPKIAPFMPDENSEINWELKNQPGLKTIELQLMLGLDLNTDDNKADENKKTESEAVKKTGKKNMADVTDEEYTLRLAAQERENKWHRFVEGNLILKQGLMNKRKGLFPRTRMFLLTTGPHLYYVDPVNMVLKGQIPWGPTIMPEAKNFKTFFVHTPNRTYYLEEPDGYALEWCKAIKEVKNFYYPNSRT